jgi:hypothetical protein
MIYNNVPEIIFEGNRIDLVEKKGHSVPKTGLARSHRF